MSTNSKIAIAEKQKSNGTTYNIPRNCVLDSYGSCEFK